MMDWSQFLVGLGIFAATCVLPWLANREDDTATKVVLWALDAFGTILSLVLIIDSININWAVATFIVLFSWVVTSLLFWPRRWRGAYVPTKKEKKMENMTLLMTRNSVLREFHRLCAVVTGAEQQGLLDMDDAIEMRDGYRVLADRVLDVLPIPDANNWDFSHIELHIDRDELRQWLNGQLAGAPEMVLAENDESET